MFRHSYDDVSRQVTPGRHCAAPDQVLRSGTAGEVATSLGHSQQRDMAEPRREHLFETAMVGAITITGTNVVYKRIVVSPLARGGSA